MRPSPLSRRPAQRWQLLAVLGAACLASLALAAEASAHATLQSSSPKRGAELDEAPKQVVFRFDESVEASLGSLSIFDSNGDRIDDGAITHPGGAGDTVATGISGDAGDGSYTATYRVISADSHPVEGGFVFQVGETGAAPSESVSQLLEASDPGPVTTGAMTLARWLAYLAIALMVGGMTFVLLIWHRAVSAVAGSDTAWRIAGERFRSRWRRVATLSVAAIVLATVMGIVLEGALGAGISGWAALKPAIVGDVLGTRFGEVWSIRALAFIALGAFVLWPRTRLMPVLRQARLGADGLAPASPPSQLSLTVVTIGCAALVVSVALAGHGSTQSPAVVLFSSISIHVAAMSAWVGGLVMLVVAVPAATRELEPSERTRLLGAVLARFSTLALASVAILISTGTLQSILELDSFADLLETGFGVAILAKIVLIALLVGAAVINRRRSLPAIAAAERGGASPGAAGLALRRTLIGEVVLVLGALAATAALASSAPPSALDQGPYASSGTMGPARVDITVDSATVGPNEAHVYLTDSQSGVPFSKIKQLTATAEQAEKGIGPLELEPRKSGPGHYTIPGAQLAAPGTWTIELTARVSAFDEYETKFEVPIR